MVEGVLVMKAKCQPTSKRLEEAWRLEERVREIVTRPRVIGGNSTAKTHI